ncbi:hypothetical protein ALQ09_05660 [Pseudomonas viridiflava]|nr:hypothetical protein ALQ09_05660 [Pseudomonas viridiflava]
MSQDRAFCCSSLTSLERNALAAQVVVVGTAEVDHAAWAEFDDAGCQRGHELAVVADENQGARVVFQRKVQRFDGFHVQVVGRFVHHQHVRFLQDQLAEQHAALFTTGNHFDRLEDLVIGEQHAAQSATYHLLAALRPLAHPVEEGRFVFEIVSVVLSVVTDFCCFGPLDRACIGLQLVDQGAQQGGLADAVRTDDCNTLAGFDLETEVLEQCLAVEAFGHAIDNDCLTVQLFGLFETNERADTAGRLDLGQLDLVDRLGSGSGLLGFRCVGRKAADERLQLGDLRFLLGVVGQQLLAGLGRHGHVLVIVAREQAQLAVIQVGHVRAHAVQEVTVVGDDDHQAVALGEDVFQPANGVDVQVVGWFVEQQHFRIGEQCLRQQNAQLPAGRHFAHRAVVLLDADTQAQQQFAGTGLGSVAVHFRKLGFQLCHGHAVVFAHFRQRVDAVALGLDLPQLFMTHDHGVEHREFFVGELILAQLTQSYVRLQHHLTARRLKVATEDFHEGGFAAAVRANQAVTVTGAKLDRDVLEQGFGAELHRDVSCGDQLLYLSITWAITGERWCQRVSGSRADRSCSACSA